MSMLIADRRGRPSTLTRVGRAAVPTVIVLTAAVIAISLHRNGHTLGDDFALYVRQAASLFEGNPAEVVADNRFTVVNSPAGISPIAYPWGWPLVLSPFVHLWGLDFDRLKLVEVATFCIALVLLHGVVRRRTNRWIAAAVTATIALSPVYLGHTDQLLTEYPHLAAVLLVVWWIDRLVDRAPDRERPWLSASTRDLVIVGLLAALAFNMRREAVVMFGVFAAAQLVDVVRTSWPRIPGATSRIDLWKIATPYLSMIAGIVGFQLLLPTALIPDNGGGLENVPERLGDALSVIPHQLGLGEHPVIGAVLMAMAVVGAVFACAREPVRNVPLVALVGLSTIAVSTHFRLVDRYYLQVAPFVVFFAAYAVLAAVDWATGRRTGPPGRLATAIVLVPLAVMVPVHLAEVADDVDRAQEFNDAGGVQWGPGHPGFVPVFAAVERYTPPDSVLAFFRARTMTLYTDRRAIQPGTLPTIALRADYYAMQKNSTYSQPLVSDAEAAELGLTKVWEDGRWVLWKLPSTPVPAG
jgi:hypothetical protein